MGAPLFERLASLLTLSNVADVASLISLCVAIYVALNIRAIKKKYIFRLRAPVFIRSLTKQASVLQAYGDDFENSIQDIGDELVKMDAKLRSMKETTRGASKRSIKKLRSVIKEYNNEPKNKQKFRLIYREIQGVIIEVEQSREDLNLEWKSW
jgi:hypothetical protein